MLTNNQLDHQEGTLVKFKPIKTLNFIQENTYENVFCKISAILFKGQYDNLFFINDRFSIWSYFHTVTIYLLIIAVVADGLLQVFGQRIVGQATLGPTESLLQHVVLPRLTRDIIALQE